MLQRNRCNYLLQFSIGNVVLQCGITLPAAKPAYKTYGALAAARDNVILMPTFYGGQHVDTEAMMGGGRALDPARYFIVVPNMFGNGLSSSASDTSPPFDRAAFPKAVSDPLPILRSLPSSKRQLSY